MTPTSSCRACEKTALELVLDLGVQPLANNLLRPGDVGKPEPAFPLRLMRCRACHLLQINDLVPPVSLFSQYIYFSSFSPAWVEHARVAAEHYIGEYALGPKSLVVEIASNDGYMLQNFVRKGIRCYGIEPAKNIAEVARKNGVDTVEEFFDRRIAVELATGRGRADLILGSNVFAHAPDIQSFVGGLAALLGPDGRIVLEFPYALDMLEKAEFDTIYHEHVYYFSLLPLQPLFERFGLEIFNVERLKTHGGSLRLFAAHRGRYPASAAVGEMVRNERDRGLDRPERYAAFASAAEGVRTALRNLLSGLKAKKATVAAYGAAAKGSTLLNFCKLDTSTIDFVADRSTYKQGLLMPGVHIPVVAPEELARRRPDYAVMLSWNFADEILAQQQDYRDRGGKFVIPVPTPHIV